MKVFIFSILLLLASQVKAEQYPAGVILPLESASYDEYPIRFPLFGLHLYEKPQSDSSIGCLALENVGPEAQGYRRLMLETDKEQKELPYEYVEEVGYEVSAVKFQAAENGFIQIMDGIWVEIEELIGNGFNNTSWMEFLIQESGNVLGYFANDPGLNIRTGPSTTFEKILTIHGDRMQIDLTEEVEGLWNKVSVTVHDIDPCEGEQKVKKRLEGWVKLLDDDGTPNISWYSRGC